VHDGPGEDEVERRTTAFRNDGVDDVRERAAADEERERLVLVRRPDSEEPAEDARKCGGDSRGASPENVDLLRAAV
jgi:hypothetical protein